MEEMAQDQYVEFIVKDVKYAITIHHVHEIIRLQEITQIPNDISYVKGVINLRGKVLPVVDLRERMGLDGTEATKLTRILVVSVKSELYGVIVDEVNRVTTLLDIAPPPEYAVHGSRDFIAGIAKEHNALINIIHADRIFAQ
jgi:purine-binding chemotaxis protein CheW